MSEKTDENNDIDLSVSNSDSVVINFKESKPYELDFEKINTVEDIIAILKGMNITVYSGFDSFDKLEAYLKPKSLNQ